MKTGRTDASLQFEERAAALESQLSGINSDLAQSSVAQSEAIRSLQEKVSLLVNILSEVLPGAGPGDTGGQSGTPAPESPRAATPQPEAAAEVAPDAGK